MYSSVKEQMAAQRARYIALWLAGEIEGTTGNRCSKHIRRWLFEQNESKCSKCSWSEVNPSTGRVPLEVDHIDGNHLNSRPENLRLLCPNCHSLTPTFRNLNKGKGRKNR